MSAWMILVALVVLPIFFARDCFLLRMGPVATTLARLRMYAGADLASVIVLSVVTTSLTTHRLLQHFASLPVCLSVVLFFGALAAICVWVRRTERHHLAWRIAVLPNPIQAGGVVLLARFILPVNSPLASPVAAALVACLWVALVGLSVWRTRSSLMDVQELDFSLQLAGLVNSAALILPPLLLLVNGGAD